jgi:lipopolysaccharide transport system ATP-binding protein
MSDVAIRAVNLGKRYRIGDPHRCDTLRDAIGGWRFEAGKWMRRMLNRISRRQWSDANTMIWALSNIEFAVKRGKVLGIIGANGAGKSTLLKILSRVTRPTVGWAEVRGRVGSLLEVGTGFHPELTGRENIYLNGAVLGMTRSEIERKFDEIVSFAEIEQFLDTPVKRYSSGMYMRLAFSVAAHLEPDILIVDEVLAVGDAAFQRKCLGNIGNVAREGRTVLFVSHNMHAVLALSQEVMWLDAGKVRDHGKPADMVRRYLESGMSNSVIPLNQRRDRSGDSSVKMTWLQVESLDRDGIIRSGSCLKISIGYRCDTAVRHPQFVVSIYDEMDIGIFVLHNEIGGGLPQVLPPEGTVTCVTEPIRLTPGRCVVHLELLRGNVRADYVSYAGHFDVESDPAPGSTIVLPRNWALCSLNHRWLLDDAGETQGLLDVAQG